MKDEKSLDAWAKIPNPTVISPNGFKVLTFGMSLPVLLV